MQARRLGPSSGWERSRRSTTSSCGGDVALGAVSSLRLADVRRCGRRSDRRRSPRSDCRDWTASVEEGRAQYERQRRFFGRVEIEQVHNFVSWQGTCAGSRRREAGRIDRIGVTHWSAGSFDELERALRTGSFDVVQLPLSLASDAGRAPPSSGRRELGIAVIVMRPFGGTGARLLRTAPRGRSSSRSEPSGSNVGAGAPQVGAVGHAGRLAIPATSRPDRARRECGCRDALARPRRARVGRLART
jgi:hypothetical protein